MSRAAGIAKSALDFGSALVTVIGGARKRRTESRRDYWARVRRAQAAKRRREELVRAAEARARREGP